MVIGNAVFRTGFQEGRPADVKGAAQEFEALLIAQTLRSARESCAGGWSGSTEDSSSDSIRDLAEQHMAHSLASAGGLGLAKLLSEGLSRQG